MSQISLGIQTPLLLGQYVHGFEPLVHGSQGNNGSALISWMRHDLLRKLERDASLTIDENGQVTQDGQQFPVTSFHSPFGHAIVNQAHVSDIVALNMSLDSAVIISRDLSFSSTLGNLTSHRSGSSRLWQHGNGGHVQVGERRMEVASTYLTATDDPFSPVGEVHHHINGGGIQIVSVTDLDKRNPRQSYEIGFKSESMEEATLALEVSGQPPPTEAASPLLDLRVKTDRYSLYILTENLRLFLNVASSDLAVLATELTRLVYVHLDNPEEQAREDGLKGRVWVGSHLRGSLMMVEIHNVDDQGGFMGLPLGLVGVWEFIKWNALTAAHVEKAFQRVLETKNPVTLHVTHKDLPWVLSFSFNKYTNRVVMTAQRPDLQQLLSSAKNTEDLKIVIAEAYACQDYQTLMHAYIAMGNQYFQSEETYDAALHYFLEARQILSARHSDYDVMSNVLNKITHILVEQGKKDQAYELCLSFLRKRWDIQDERARAELAVAFATYLWSLAGDIGGDSAGDQERVFQDVTELINEGLECWHFFSPESRSLFAEPLIRVLKEMTARFPAKTREIDALRRSLLSNLVASARGGG